MTQNNEVDKKFIDYTSWKMKNDNVWKNGVKGYDKITYYFKCF